MTFSEQVEVNIKILRTNNEPYEEIIYAQPSISPGEGHTYTPIGFLRKNGSPNLGQTTRSYNNQQKKMAKLWTLLSKLTKE